MTVCLGFAVTMCRARSRCDASIELGTVEEMDGHQGATQHVRCRLGGGAGGGPFSNTGEVAAAFLRPWRPLIPQAKSLEDPNDGKAITMMMDGDGDRRTEGRAFSNAND